MILISPILRFQIQTYDFSAHPYYICWKICGHKINAKISDTNSDYCSPFNMKAEHRFYNFVEFPKKNLIRRHLLPVFNIEGVMKVCTWFKFMLWFQDSNFKLAWLFFFTVKFAEKISWFSSCQNRIAPSISKIGHIIDALCYSQIFFEPTQLRIFRLHRSSSANNPKKIQPAVVLGNF